MMYSIYLINIFLNEENIIIHIYIFCALRQVFGAIMPLTWAGAAGEGG